MRTLVDIPDYQIESLSFLCKKFDISRAEAIRKGIELFIQGNRESTEDVFGIWKSKNRDGLTYQEHIRDEW